MFGGAYMWLNHDITLLSSFHLHPLSGWQKLNFTSNASSTTLLQQQQYPMSVWIYDKDKVKKTKKLHLNLNG